MSAQTSFRSHLCRRVDETLAGNTVVLCGWANTRRDHGGVIFIDLRDHSGVVQVVIEPDNAAAFAAADRVRYEFCLRIEGNVRARPASQVNERLSTGKIEAFGNNQTGPVKSTTATGLDDGNWHFFAWAVDSSGGGHHVVDSAVDNTYTGGGTLVTPTSVDMFVARNSVSGIANWSGSIAWFAMFGSKLSVATLLEHRATISGLS